jgi:hypothetical protein
MVDESGMSSNQMGMHNDQKWSRCKGRLERSPHSSNSKQYSEDLSAVRPAPKL